MVGHSKQVSGTDLCKTLCKQVSIFYEKGMDENSKEDWIILFSLPTETDEKWLCWIFKQIKDKHTSKCWINLSQSIKAGKNQPERLPEKSGNSARVGENRQQGGISPTCFVCQMFGHSKGSCKVDENLLWCDCWKPRVIEFWVNRQWPQRTYWMQSNQYSL